MAQKYPKLWAIVLVPIVVYLLSCGMVIFYYPAYEKLILEHSADKELAKFKTPNVIAFFQGKQELIGFTPQEKEHLRDVKWIIWLLLTFSALGAFVLFIIHDKKAMVYGGLISLIMPLLLLLIPFNILFDLFHNLLFAPGTWIFMPDSILIQMYPLEFFYGFFKDILLRGFILGLVITIIFSIDALKRKLYFILQQN